MNYDILACTGGEYGKFSVRFYVNGRRRQRERESETPSVELSSRDTRAGTRELWRILRSVWHHTTLVTRSAFQRARVSYTYICMRSLYDGSLTSSKQNHSCLVLLYSKLHLIIQNTECVTHVYIIYAFSRCMVMWEQRVSGTRLVH